MSIGSSVTGAIANLGNSFRLIAYGCLFVSPDGVKTIQQALNEMFNKVTALQATLSSNHRIKLETFYNPGWSVGSIFTSVSSRSADGINHPYIDRTLSIGNLRAVVTTSNSSNIYYSVINMSADINSCSAMSLQFTSSGQVIPSVGSGNVWQIDSPGWSIAYSMYEIN